MDLHPHWLQEHGASSLARLMPRIEARFAADADPAEWEAYVERMRRHFPRLFTELHALYGHHYDFFYHLESILVSATELWLERSDELKALDGARAADPHWYQSNQMVGASCYVDRFAGTLDGLRDGVPYLSELGVTCLHLMPLFEPPEGDDDGGYAVRSYRRVDPALGSMDELAKLATELRHRGISLALDFVFNHTSDEHEWAERALDGDAEHQAYYRMYPNREMPDAFERSMPEVFTDDHPGAFTYRSEVRKWVWTTFHTYQWDLNYENPVVFNRMLEEMLFLANQGVEVLRLDAVAFLWKRLGTNCQNLPEAHRIIGAFNAVAAIAAPAMTLLSEAIVHPDEVRKYVSVDECPLSYNPQLMALLWEAMATRDVRVLQSSMTRRFKLPEGCTWLNYVRGHDDIGWAFADDEVEASGFDPAAHRAFLTDFYTGRFEGSFARGEPFQPDPVTGLARVSGTCASLCGVERALEAGDDEALDLAVRRILLIHGVAATIGGIPLLYLGDEIATLNDYGYQENPEMTGDSRWLHRPAFDAERAQLRHDPDSVPGRVYHGLLRLLRLRKSHAAFGEADTEITDTGTPHVFGFIRSHEDRMIFVLANFTEHPQAVEARRLRQMGLRKTAVDLYAGRTVTATKELVLEPYQLMVLSRGRAA
ncbi:MAG: amylosucrase [Gemmatimonadota bacterium]